ncbi:MAG: CHASE4 domain-containing protein [Terricaulis sp.]
MSARVLDYAGWDETYAFVGGRNNAFVAENFTDDWLGGYNLDLAVFTNDDGDIPLEQSARRRGQCRPRLGRGERHTPQCPLDPHRRRAGHGCVLERGGADDVRRRAGDTQ